MRGAEPVNDSPLLAYARELIAHPSTSSLSNLAVTALMRDWLEELGFEIEEIPYQDPAGTPKTNLVARRGSGSGGLAYFGHNDCVPADHWTGPGGPFEPVVTRGRLYGRGACDMKGSLAAMLEAARRTQGKPHRQPLYYVCTGDEEVGYLGAQAVVAQSELYRELVREGARAVIGEPTRLRVVHAHKGGAGYRFTAHGVAAHSSTAKGRNANLAMIPLLAELAEIHDEIEIDPKWQHPEFDPPTLCMNIGINDRNPAPNITAPQSVCTVYLRPMPGIDIEPILERLRAVADAQGLEMETLIDGPPVYTSPKAPIIQELLELTGLDHSETVGYGTDASIFQDIEQLAIFGPGDVAQAHTDDEWIALEQLERGADYYTQLIAKWCHE